MDDFDRRRYLGFLRVGSVLHGLVVYAYALMSNHVHLLLKTRRANISSAMCWIHLGYSKAFNSRHGCSGHLFGTRFKSRLVQKDRYFMALLRYIHMNPVKAGLAASPEASAWTSHRAYLGEKDGIVRDTKEAFRMLSDNPCDGLALYREFICRPIPENELKILASERNGRLGTLPFLPKR